MDTFTKVVDVDVDDFDDDVDDVDDDVDVDNEENQTKVARLWTH